MGPPPKPFPCRARPPGRAVPSPWGEGGPQGRMRGRPAGRFRSMESPRPFGPPYPFCLAALDISPWQGESAPLSQGGLLCGRPRAGEDTGPYEWCRPCRAGADSPCQGADSPCQGEMSRSDRGDREMAEGQRGLGDCPRQPVIPRPRRGRGNPFSFEGKYGLPRRACGPPGHDGQRVVFVGRGDLGAPPGIRPPKAAAPAHPGRNSHARWLSASRAEPSAARSTSRAPWGSSRAA